MNDNLDFQNIIPGEHFLSLSGEAGEIEAILLIPPNVNPLYCAILGHPHSLQGGTMHNKVVTTLARAFKECQIPSLRFNFRGVGKSKGCYNNGIGESMDMLILAEKWRQTYSNCNFIFAGFSFGSYVAYRAAAQTFCKLLITIAPPVNHFNYEEFVTNLPSWHIIQGENDEVVPTVEVKSFAQKQNPPLPLYLFPNTGHFFHGKLLALKEKLVEIIKSEKI